MDLLDASDYPFDYDTEDEEENSTRSEVSTAAECKILSVESLTKEMNDIICEASYFLLLWFWFVICEHTCMLPCQFIIPEILPVPYRFAPSWNFHQQL